MPNRRDNLMAQFGRRASRERGPIASINRPNVRPARRAFSSPALTRARAKSQKRQLF